MGNPIDIKLPPDQLKAAIAKALDNKIDYGVFQPHPKYPNRRVWTGEMEVPIGDSVSLKWDPKLKEGYIDVKGSPGKNMDDLFAEFDKARGGLPKGKFILHPGEAEDASGNLVGRKALKHKLYKRRFRNDPQITLNEDLNLRNLPGGSQESFTLDTTKPIRTMARRRNYKEFVVDKTLTRNEQLSKYKSAANKFIKENPEKELSDFYERYGQLDGIPLKNRARRGLSKTQPDFHVKGPGTTGAVTNRIAWLKQTTPDPGVRSQANRFVKVSKGPNIELDHILTNARAAKGEAFQAARRGISVETQNLIARQAYEAAGSGYGHSEANLQRVSSQLNNLKNVEEGYLDQYYNHLDQKPSVDSKNFNSWEGTRRVLSERVSTARNQIEGIDQVIAEDNLVRSTRDAKGIIDYKGRKIPEPNLTNSRPTVPIKNTPKLNRPKVKWTPKMKGGLNPTGFAGVGVAGAQAAGEFASGNPFRGSLRLGEAGLEAAGIFVPKAGRAALLLGHALDRT